MSPKRIIHDCHRLNWLFRSAMVRTSSSTADLASNKQCAERMPLALPYAIPRISRIRCVFFEGNLLSMKVLAIIRTATKKVPNNHMRNWPRPSRVSNWLRLWEGSVTEPKMPIRMAPIATRMVPTRESNYRQRLPLVNLYDAWPSSLFVKGSPNIKVAHIVLNTSPD
jgi:hypothetical protein